MSKRSLVGALCLMLWLGASVVVAQEDPGRISPGIVGATKALTDEEQKAVVRYVEFHIERLKNAKELELSAAARNRLEEPYAQGGTDFFLSFYDQALGGRLAGALGSDKWFNRMNAMLAASRVKDGRVADAIKGGLGDASSATVYAAAKAAAAFADPDKNKVANAAAKQSLIAPLLDAMKKEKNPFTLEFIFQALINAGDVKAFNAVLVRLREMADARAAGGGGPISVEGTSIGGVYNRLATADVNKESLDEATLKLLVLVAVRYMEVAANMLTDKPGEQSLQSLLNTCDTAAQFGATVLTRNAANKFKVPATIKGQSISVTKLTILDWKEALKAAPFNFKPVEIDPGAK